MSTTTHGPLRTSDLIFPSASTNISSLLGSITKSSQSIRNRLQSIDRDSTFVASVQHETNLPLVANERCGSWYIPPSLRAGSCYFKSTDGHHGQWAFSLRRLNLHILELIGRNGGCVIVDSTRRGKHMPDALSKTVPIWCAVMNRLLFPETELGFSHNLEPLPELISHSEHVQIETKLSDFVREAKRLDLDTGSLRGVLKKPLRPKWICRSLDLKPRLSSSAESDSCHPVYLCTASIPTHYSRSPSYIQGAGDDSENWAHGLTPFLYWKHKHELLRTNEADLPKLMARLVVQGKNDSFSPAMGIKLEKSKVSIPLSTDSKVCLSLLADAREVVRALEDHSSEEVWLVIVAHVVNPLMQDKFGRRLVQLKCRTGKLGSRDLRTELAKLVPLIESLEGKQDEISKVLIFCTDVNDLAVGVALVLLCLYEGSFDENDAHADKSGIRKKLSIITSAMPNANPSRATINAVNSFLIKEPVNFRTPRLPVPSSNIS